MDVLTSRNFLHYDGAMHLKAYIDENLICPIKLRQALGIAHRQAMYEFIHGIRVPPPEIMRRIEHLTGGRVTEAEMREYRAKAVLADGPSVPPPNSDQAAA